MTEDMNASASEKLLCLGLCRRLCLDRQAQQALRVAAGHQRHVLFADALDPSEEADGIRLRHVERIIGTEHDVIGAPDLDKVLELAFVEYDSVEIELLQVFRRLLLDGDAAILAMRPCVVEAAPIAGDVAAAMGDADFQFGKP